MSTTLPDRILASPSPPGVGPGAVFLETDRLILRRFLASDASAVAAAANHRSIFNNLRDRMPSPYTPADAEEFVGRRYGEKNLAAYPDHSAVFVKPNAAGNLSTELLFVGTVGIVPKDDVEYRTWEVGYWFTPSSWGKGFATEAVGAFVRWLFATWPHLNRVEAGVFSSNQGSARVLAKCGFALEGIRRGAVEKCGVLMDEHIFGLVRGDLGSFV